MNDSKTAKQILAMLNDQKRRAHLIKLWIVIAVTIIAWAASSRWESPLAVMPQTATTFALGCLFLYGYSIKIYPKISKYFDIEALKRDASQDDQSRINDNDDA